MNSDTRSILQDVPAAAAPALSIGKPRQLMMPLGGLSSAAAAAAALSACGGAEGPVGATESSRFLAQASLGADHTQITRVQAIGYAAWLDEQMACTRVICV